MKIDEILEVNREFVIRLIDDMGDYEDVQVSISSEHISPKSIFFTHCEIKLNDLRHRTIDGHIKYLQSVIKGLEELKERLKGAK